MIDPKAKFAAAPTSAAPCLALRDIAVRYPGVLALDNASLEVSRGEVHGLMGENGAGKSTLLKVLSGVIQPDAGTISIDGVVRRFSDARAALDSGIAIIYQELHLVPELTVADNLLLGQLPSRCGVVHRQQMLRRALQGLQQLGEDLDPDCKVKRLSIGQRQMIEIGKALLRDAFIIAFDEPTSSLSSREADRLLAIIRELRHQGRAIIYVSHRLEEVYALCDRVTVFRDGCRIRTFEDVTAADHQPLVQAMVGRPVSDIYAYAPRDRGAVQLEVRALIGRGLSTPASFRAYAGEILGFFGLVGAGRTELMKLIFSDERPNAGEVWLNGSRVRLRSPTDAVRLGIALCPEDRKQEGIIAIASVADNINLSCRRHSARFGLILNRKREVATAAELIDRLDIRTASQSMPIGQLSGGNQQKVILARWLAESIKVFLMDEPTRGIDVGARSEIYQLLYGLAAAGRTVILVSSDIAEIVGVCDRVIVMREGSLVADLARAEVSPERLIQLALPHYSGMQLSA